MRKRIRDRPRGGSTLRIFSGIWDLQFNGILRTLQNASTTSDTPLRVLVNDHSFFSVRLPTTNWANLITLPDTLAEFGVKVDLQMPERSREM
jgi:hypothetical protein